MDWVAIVILALTQAWLLFQQYQAGSWALVRSVKELHKRLELLDGKVEGVQDSLQYGRSHYANLIQAVKKLETRVETLEDALHAVERETQSRDWEKELMYQLLGAFIPQQQGVDTQGGKSEISRSGAALRRLQLLNPETENQEVNNGVG